jgi:hypothetical protein
MDKLLKRSLIFLSFIITSLSINAKPRDIFIDDLINGHYEVLDNLTIEELGYFRSGVASIMKRYSKGKMTDEMVKYFAGDLNASRHFLKAYHLAEDFSREICGLDFDSKRHSLDEVDAIRHFIWSSYLTYYLGEKKAREIFSLQERTRKLKKASKMDLYNNERGIQFVKLIMRKRTSFNKYVQEEYVLKYLDQGLFKVIKSRDSSCSRSDLYPNY